MTGPTGLLNFFVLEASEYVEQLDALLGTAGSAGPDAESFTRAARALRGSATMAKLSGISALAAATERIGRALRERALPWTPALRGALTATVDDLRVLVRGARSWGEAEDRRAQARTAELLGFVPPATRVTSPTPIATSTGALFVVSGATDVAAAFTAAVSRPGNPELLAEALRRLRGLRGVASIKDYPPLPELLDSLERAARPAGTPGESLAGEDVAVLAAGARWLRRAAEDVRAGRRPDPQSDEAAAFQEAMARAAAARSERDRIVPVRELYYDDEGPHVVHTATAPATTVEDRFRLEAAGAAEHVRRLVADARSTAKGDRPGAVDGATVSAAVDALVSVVRSFDRQVLADALALLTSGVASLDPVALAAADAAAALFVGRHRSISELDARMTDLLGGRVVGTVVSVGYSPVERPRITPPGLGALGLVGGEVAPRSASVTPIASRRPTPATIPAAAPTSPPPIAAAPPAPPTPAAPPPWTAPASSSRTATPEGTATPSGRHLHALLEDGIAGIARLQQEPAPAPSRPTPAMDDVVPIETLLYRGRAALGRAIELRDEIRRDQASPSQAQLDELFDLLELAALS